MANVASMCRVVVRIAEKPHAHAYVREDVGKRTKRVVGGRAMKIHGSLEWFLAYRVALIRERLADI